MSRYFIGGAPGMGKTEIGKYLYEIENFFHIDLEDGTEEYFNDPNLFLNKVLQRKEDKTVITGGIQWNFHDINILTPLKQAGFKMIFFDGDRKAALREFIKRETRINPDPNHLEKCVYGFNEQLKRIDNSKYISIINPYKINPFKEDHSFRAKDEIIKEIKTL